MKVLFNILIFLNLSAHSNDHYSFFNSKWKISKNAYKALLNENVLAKSEVSSKDKVQKFKMQAIAFHPKKCRKVIKKLARFENYPDMIDFIKSTTYHEKNHFLTVKADHTLLPFPMIVHIVMKRPDKEGVYKFKFPTGIFKGLSGTFTIKEVANKCSVYAESFWQGQTTKIPNLVIEIFSETLTKIAVQTLIRKTML